MNAEKRAPEANWQRVRSTGRMRDLLTRNQNEIRKFGSTS